MKKRGMSGVKKGDKVLTKRERERERVRERETNPYFLLLGTYTRAYASTNDLEKFVHLRTPTRVFPFHTHDLCHLGFKRWFNSCSGISVMVFDTQGSPGVKTFFLPSPHP